MKKVELLAPAGTIESLYAAINKGADAVYMGGTKFSARAYASNFTNENLKDAVDYAHLYGVKVYIALNTLIKEDEMKEAMEYADFLYSIGVDALIIQDFGIAQYLKGKYEDFELHSSTQMSTHNGEGAKFLTDNGFQRIVLARELNLDEIKYISSDLNIETEIFVHGALCICYSGQCLMSSIIGGRSGNRGRCAQPCRLPYELINTENGLKKKAYILSPKDMCNIENIEDLMSTGTSSLKIEGRMKRFEYVAGVVETYRKAIDSYYKSDSHKFDLKKGRKTLLQLFNREGFSKAYLYKNDGRDMMSYKFPKNTGTFIGKVLNNCSIILEEDISLGDGIRFGEKGFTLSKIIKGSKEVDKAYKGDEVILYPRNYKPHDILYKTLDEKLMKNYSSDSKPFERKILLDCSIKFKVNENIEIRFEYLGYKFKIDGDMVEVPKTRAMEKERICESLRKCNDTPFKFQNIEFIEFDDGFIPISSINKLRRDAVEELQRHVIENYKKNHTDIVKYKKYESWQSSKKIPMYIPVICTKSQLAAVNDEKLECAALNIFTRGTEALNEESIKEVSCRRVYLKVPNIIKSEFNFVAEVIERNLGRIDGIITANLGIINVFKGKTAIIGDYKLNIYNSMSAQFFDGILDSVSLSIELNRSEITSVMSRLKDVPVNYLIYGRPELMVSEYCPVGSLIGGKNHDNGCHTECMKGTYILKDRKNEEFLIKNDIYCRTHIYNGAKINLLDNIKEMKGMGISSFRMDFIDENYHKTRAILRYAVNGIGNIENDNYTRGHYRRGVE